MDVITVRCRGAPSEDKLDVIADPNNNTEEKSYSLRPRISLRKDEEDTDPEDWRPRGRVKRRAKQKSLPLSKYRRKTANARERSRMREINDAFEALRRVLPHCASRSENPQEKTTKIMTLRMAMKYIAAMGSALRQADGDSDGESLISDSLTASSLSDLDQLFAASSFDEWPSPAVAAAASPFFTDPLRPPSTALDVPNLRAKDTSLLNLSPTDPSPTAPLGSLVDIQDWRVLDCLPSSPVNLDDLFIT